MTNQETTRHIILADFIFGKIHLKNNKNNLKIHINNNESKNIINLKLLDAFECVEVKRWNFIITYSVVRMRVAATL